MRWPSSAVYTRFEVDRCLKFAFDIARKRNKTLRDPVRQNQRAHLRLTIGSVAFMHGRGRILTSREYAHVDAITIGW